MRTLSLAFVCLLFFAGYGQIKHSHRLTIGLGNEWNAFLSPYTLIVDEEFRSGTENWDNGTFQAISLNNTFKIEGERHKLKLKINGSLGLYQTEQNSNRYTFRIGTSYRLKYASKKYLEFAPELFRKRREGINTDNAVLATPFSYLLVRVPIGLDFYLGNKSWLKTEAGYLYKNYDKVNGEKLFYQAPYFEASYSKKWESDAGIKKLSLQSETQLRTYETLSIVIQEFDEEDEEEEIEEEILFNEGSRNWTYQFTPLQLDFDKKNDGRKMVLGLYHISRIDQNSRSTYQEIGPGIRFDKWGKKGGVNEREM